MHIIIKNKYILKALWKEESVPEGSLKQKYFCRTITFYRVQHFSLIK